MSIQQKYDAAIALNNSAVSLLQRSCSEEAVATFRDAIEILKLSMPEDENSDNGKEEQADGTLQKIDLHVNSASKRLAKASVIKCENGGDTADANRKKGSRIDFNLIIITDDRSSDVLAEAALQYDVFGSENEEEDCDTTFSSFAIRLDDSMDNDEPDMHIESAVVLYNYGVACRCYAYGMTTEMHRFNQVIENSKWLFHLSYSVLTQQLSRFSHDENSYRRTILLTMLVLQNVGQIALETNSLDEAHMIYREHSRLRTAFQARAHNRNARVAYRNMAPAA